MPRKIYLASGLSDAEKTRDIMVKLKLSNWIRTYDWTVHGLIEDQGQHAFFAVREVNGVKRADVLGVVGPGGRGTHIEIGIAIGRGIPVVLWDLDPEEGDKKYGYPSIFYAHPLVFKVDDMNEFVFTCNALWEAAAHV